MDGDQGRVGIGWDTTTEGDGEGAVEGEESNNLFREWREGVMERQPNFNVMIMPFLDAMRAVGNGDHSSQQPGEVYAVVNNVNGEWLACATCLQSACDTRWIMENHDTHLRCIEVQQIDLFPDHIRFEPREKTPKRHK